MSIWLAGLPTHTVPTKTPFSIVIGDPEYPTDLQPAHAHTYIQYSAVSTIYTCGRYHRNSICDEKGWVRNGRSVGDLDCFTLDIMAVLASTVASILVQQSVGW